MKLPKPINIKIKKYSSDMSLLKKKFIKVKLSANESALGPSPKALKEYQKVSKNLKRYPDTQGTVLKKTLANNFKINPKQIILGAGSDQIFELICRLFLKKNDEVIVSQFSFIIYRMYSIMNSAKVKYAKENNYNTSVDNILSCVTKKTKIVFIANPNNPTGTFIPKKELLKLRKKLRSNILLVIDDAYFEYVNKSSFSSGLQLFSNYKNVIVTRTFSKLYGLASLRVGWAYGPKNIMQNLEKIKPPFNINTPAIFASCASIKDKKWIYKEIKHINKWKKIFFKVFKELEIETNDTNANFFLLNFNRKKISSNSAFKALLNSGILLRRMNIYNIKNSLRVTIGNTIENKKFISKIKKLCDV